MAKPVRGIDQLDLWKIAQAGANGVWQGWARQSKAWQHVAKYSWVRWVKAKAIRHMTSAPWTELKSRHLVLTRSWPKDSWHGSLLPGSTPCSLASLKKVGLLSQTLCIAVTGDPVFLVLRIVRKFPAQRVPSSKAGPITEEAIFRQEAAIFYPSSIPVFALTTPTPPTHLLSLQLGLQIHIFKICRALPPCLLFFSWKSSLPKHCLAKEKLRMGFQICDGHGTCSINGLPDFQPAVILPLWKGTYIRRQKKKNPSTRIALLVKCIQRTSLERMKMDDSNYFSWIFISYSTNK